MTRTKYYNSYSIGRRAAKLYKANIARNAVYVYCCKEIANAAIHMEAQDLIKEVERAVNRLEWWVMFTANEMNMNEKNDYSFRWALKTMYERIKAE